MHVVVVTSDCKQYHFYQAVNFWVFSLNSRIQAKLKHYPEKSTV